MEAEKTMAVRELDAISTATPAVLHKETPRRAFLLKLGFLLNGLAAFMVGAPVIGYLMSSFRTTGAFKSWITLGTISSFPESQTRLAKFRNPY